MPPIRNAPSAARERLTNVLEKTLAMVRSNKFEALVKRMDKSLTEQAAAMGNIEGLLHDSGIPVPQGVSFSVRLNSARSGRGQIQVELNIVFVGHHEKTAA